MHWFVIGYAAILACAVRVLLRAHRSPESRVAWLAVIFALPGVGVLAYILLGETNIGRRRAERIHRLTEGLPRPETLSGWPVVEPGERIRPLFQVGQSISGYAPVTGNKAALMESSDAAIDRMVADVDAATRHVHLVFYIWLTDANGMKMVQALKRAAARGVAVRAMVDDLGSRYMVRSRAWADMRASGVQVARALPIGNPIMRALGGRIDLRNHRKILVIDNEITYCGSQNCADPDYSPKPRFAPWVDVMVRFEGPVARQNQHLFATDWMANVDEDISDVLNEPLAPVGKGLTAQVIGTGPTVRSFAMPDTFVSCMYAAHRRLVITTPYYVPNAMVQSAIVGAARRGVETTLILPKKNDHYAVGVTARSYYADLLQAGVKLYEYRLGLLHTKALIVDDDVTLIGSANLDRRSFDLNYENNILFQDAALTAAMLERQMSYIADSDEITLPQVQIWPISTRLWNNALAVIGPLL